VAAAKQTPLKPDQIEGKWGGEIIASAGEECSFERQELRAAVSGGSFTGQARIGNTQHNFQGKVGSNADALIYAELPITGIGDNVKVRLKGRFTDKGFDGYFYGDNGRSSDFGRCSGTVKLARLGDWKRQAAQLKAKEDAEHAKLESEKQEVDRLAKLVAQAKAKKAALEAKQQDQTLSAQLTAERQATERLTAALAEQKARLAKFEEDKRREKAKSRQVAARSNLPPEIEQLKQIAKSGLIDQKEFQARKKAILDRIFGAVPASATSTIANIKFGKYHALVIGIDAYRNLPRLKTAVADAKAVTKELKDNYGFEVTELINPTRDQMLDTMDDLQASLTFKDNLLIYYAGHGWLNEKSDQGYWLPIDAKKNRRSRWVSNSTLTDTLTALEAKHVMVVADSCYSGRLVRSANVNIENASSAEYYQQMSRKKARVVITSGGLEPVEDGKGEHSPFARAFLSALSKNNSVIDGTKLFNAIRRPVMVNADQTPQYSDVRRAGHDGGDFLFVRRK